MASNDELINAYDAQFTVFTDFNARTERMIRDLLNDEGIQIHSISSRVKARNSFLGKIGRIGKNYNSIEQITDLSGVRIITYFEEDIKIVAEIVEREFSIDAKNSGDKRELLGPNRFGYLSVHYVASLNKQRTRLREYRRFSGLKCEIQIRSILQHAWAEMEHDLGYKSTTGLPESVQRRFARLAGLFELADEQLNSIRAELIQHEKNVASDMKADINSVSIDRASLVNMQKENKCVSDLTEFMLNNHLIQQDEENWDNSSLIDNVVRILGVMSITNIGQFSNFICKNISQIEHFSTEYLADTEGFFIDRASVFILVCYYMAAQTDNIKQIRVVVGKEFDRVLIAYRKIKVKDVTKDAATL